MLLKMTALALFGLCAGGVIAAGIFAFLAIIGVFPRLIGKTGTKKHIMLYETAIILGGALVMSLAETLKTLPVINRRIHLSVGLQYVIFAIGLGKMLGSLLYFSAGIAAP